MADKPWDGRFLEKTDKLVERFTASIQFDARLFEEDIDGSIAHSRMLAKAGIITPREADKIAEGLNRIRQEIKAGSFTYADSLEDIHMHIEARLKELIGETASKLHTARSRNDQVALDVRLYLRKAVKRLCSQLDALREIIVDLAADHLDVIMPGYTHLQRAQPVLLAHHLMAYYEMFSRDRERLAETLVRINVMPLGTAALAGTTFPVNREEVAQALDFPEVSANSIDTVSDRDFLMEFLADAGICMVHFSRLAEELILWSTAEFDFVELPDAFTTGSSMMPQKKNPDVAELTRGKTGRVFGDLMALLTMMKALPLSYNRDLQEDKEPMFHAVDTLSSCLELYCAMLPKIRFKRQQMTAAANKGFLNATDFADYLVRKGMAFRDAHHITGRAVAYALENKLELHEVPLEKLQMFFSAIGADVYAALQPDTMVNRRQTSGGTATAQVKEAIQKAKASIQRD